MKVKSVLSTDQRRWPEGLRQKYRKLAIPAVVAAVAPDKPREDSERRGKTADERERSR